MYVRILLTILKSIQTHPKNGNHQQQAIHKVKRAWCGHKVVAGGVSLSSLSPSLSLGAAHPVALVRRSRTDDADSFPSAHPHSLVRLLPRE